MQMQGSHLTVDQGRTRGDGVPVGSTIHPLQELHDLLPQQGLHLEGLHPHQLLTELEEIVVLTAWLPRLGSTIYSHCWFGVLWF